MKGDHVGILELKASHFAHASLRPISLPDSAGERLGRMSAASPLPFLLQQSQSYFGFIGKLLVLVLGAVIVRFIHQVPYQNALIVAEACNHSHDIGFQIRDPSETRP